ncbi:hypothetical protein IWZ01DRAFT_108193 [Phyllosticta capitalensis]
MPRPAQLPRIAPRPLRGGGQQQQPPPLPRPPLRHFHASARRHGAEAFPDHYKTLDLPVTASAAEIKKQFYTLSKQHHPDRNRGDPSASSRFVAISAAYHVLGSASKRSAYDAQLSSRSSSPYSSSSSSNPYASAAYSGPAGSRPASGLSRRRTAFKGPPPSFYRNGAWGAYSAKRAAYAPKDDPNSSTHDSSQSSSSSQSEDYTGSPYSSSSSSTYGGGFGPGQAHRGHDSALPHWDRAAHMRTHSEIAARFRARAREKGWGETTEEMKNGGGGWSVVANFVAVSAAIGLATGVPAVVGWR